MTQKGHVWALGEKSEFGFRITFCLLTNSSIWFDTIGIGGAQWLSGSALDSRPRGRWYEPHRRHCVMPLTHLSLPSTGSTQEDPSRHN